MSELIAVDGDEDTCDACHVPPAGGGNYPISPVDLQDFIFIEDKLVIVDNEDFEAHCGANAKATTVLAFIADIAICRNGDISQSQGCHTFEGITVSHQDFVFSE